MKKHMLKYIAVRECFHTTGGGCTTWWCPSIACRKGRRSVLSRWLREPVAQVWGPALAQHLLHGPPMGCQARRQRQRDRLPPLGCVSAPGRVRCWDTMAPAVRRQPQVRRGPAHPSRLLAPGQVCGDAEHRASTLAMTRATRPGVVCHATGLAHLPDRRSGAAIGPGRSRADDERGGALHPAPALPACDDLRLLPVRRGEGRGGAGGRVGPGGAGAPLAYPTQAIRPGPRAAPEPGESTA